MSADNQLLPSFLDQLCLLTASRMFFVKSLLNGVYLTELWYKILHERKNGLRNGKSVKKMYRMSEYLVIAQE